VDACAGGTREVGSTPLQPHFPTCIVNSRMRARNGAAERLQTSSTGIAAQPQGVLQALWAAVEEL